MKEEFLLEKASPVAETLLIAIFKKYNSTRSSSEHSSLWTNEIIESLFKRILLDLEIAVEI